MNWHEAQAACQQWSGDLLSLENREQQNLWTELTSSGNNYWIGLNDLAEEGQFKWVNGYPTTYESWGPEEPNDTTNKNCVAMGFFGDTTWDVRKCD
jgi:C-type mannose receptor